MFCFVIWNYLDPTKCNINTTGFYKNAQQLKNMFGRDETTAEKMMVGGVAGLVAQTVTYPFEVTRRRMQTSGLVSENLTKELLGGHDITSSNSKPITSSDATNSGLANGKRKTTLTMRETIQFLYKEQGERGLFKGVSMVRVVSRRRNTVSCVVVIPIQPQPPYPYNLSTIL